MLNVIRYMPFKRAPKGFSPASSPKAILASLLLILSLPSTAGEDNADAEHINIAVASNFAAPIKQLVKQYAQQHNIDIKVSLGSSGKLLAQIQHGAPFQLFLSADQQKPQRLIASGDADSESRVTYARGQLALWNASPASGQQRSPEQMQNQLQTQLQARLQQGDFNKLAIANPRLAPYGLAAQEVLQSMSLWDSTRDKRVMGENIGQTWQFVASGNAQLGFVALSQIQQPGKPYSGSVWVVPPALYSPILQDAVVLSRQGTDAQRQAAHDFLKFLMSADVQQQLAQYGYLPAGDVPAR
ncbi:molybdate ABC transporter substrate-binding protein [Oceanobacter kriegii]|uniref:molybdate ABC transporter substrate-binding protein n=1 Tax=Oceanobacter kriegii TaxID=64972 RepID=UPI0004148AF6|nr:molybdate ABC transporter substrate-binding protein [Oceanobacter kriegii]